MYEVLIAAIICLALLAGALFFVARQLVNTNREVLRWSGKVLEQNCAFNEDQRAFMQSKHEHELAINRPVAPETRAPPSPYRYPAPPEETTTALSEDTVPFVG